MEEEFRALILGIGAVQSQAGGRVDWGLSPQGGQYPCISLTVINDGPIDHSLDGPGVSQARVQIDCWAASYRAAKVLSRAVRLALDGYQGANFAGVLMAGARDLQDEDGVEPVHRVSMDFIVTYHFNG
jgi:hypothetical protein